MQGGDGGVDGEADIWSERESSYGNSLNAMDGWSTASPCHARSTLGTFGGGGGSEVGVGGLGEGAREGRGEMVD